MRTKNSADPEAWSERPVFRPRQMLTAEQLNAGLHDEMERQLLLNRAVHGYGVVAGLGLAVTDDGSLAVKDGCVELTGGLALDRHGRLLFWKGGKIGLRDVVGELPQKAGRHTLLVHYATRRPVIDDCAPYAGDQAQWRKEGVVFTLRAGCEPVDRSCAAHPDGACIGHDTYVCRRTGARPGTDPLSVPPSPDVDWVVKEQGALYSTHRDGWCYDPDPEVGVPLACVEIRDTAEPGCDPCWEFGPKAPDGCSVRPFVYRNPLLYELVKGCDVLLPRVREISWQDWIDIGWEQEGGEEKGGVEWTAFAARIVEGLTILFSRRIRVETIHEASLFLTAIISDPNTDYGLSRQVPIKFAWVGPEGKTARGVTLVPEDEWLNAEVRGSRSSLFGGARFEVTIRGQLLRDTCGRMLDARPLDIADDERGHARPGDDFVSAFRVDKREPAK